MAELSGVVRAINYLVVRIERLSDPSEIGSVVLRSDYITRMLVNLDVADNIVNTMSCLHETVLAIEADSSSSWPRISDAIKSCWTSRMTLV